jgi:predicted proteasome-type protease
VKRRIEEDDGYFREITRSWGKMLNEAVAKLPEPPWLASEIEASLAIRGG